MSVSTVLVPHDGSALSSAVVDPLLRLIDTDTAVTLLHVEGSETTSEEELARVERRVAATGASVDRRHEGYADPAVVILETVTELGPDLVAMSTHGRTGLQRWQRGSVAERVIRRCPVPVFMVNPHNRSAPGLDAILVPLDGSEVSVAILDTLLPLARTLGAKLTLLRVDWRDDTDTPAVAERRRVMRKEVLDAQLLDPTRVIEDAGLEVETRIEQGDPAEVVLRVAGSGEFGLVAMSTHGRSGPSRWLLGSTAERVLREVTVPILLRRAFPVR
jgi:nucleotide-binding universal stress UspA family protein